MGSKVKKLLGMAAPILGNIMLPGLGGVLGGAAGGALSGGGLRGALLGGLGGAVTGYSPQIGALANSGLGLNLTSAGAINALGGGIGGAALGGLSGGGLRGALMGGAQGGISSYLGNGGIGEIGESLGISGPGGLFGSSASTPSLGGTVTAKDAALPWNSGSSSTLPWNAAGGGSSSYSGGTGSSLSSLLGGISSMNANDNAEDDLLSAQQQALKRFQPYVDAKFEPGDLTQDPGYQFRLQQGEQALGRRQAASGNYFSGAALKATQDYGQGLADTTYNEAFNRWKEQNQQNIGVAGAMGGLDLEGGNARANAGINNSNVMNRTLSSLLGGYGAYTNTGANNGTRITGYDPRTGQPIYG